MKQPDAPLWKDAIQNKLNSLENMGTFKDCDSLPPGRKVIDAKFVFKIKHNGDRSIEQYKACLVAKGYYQMPGIDFDETFAPVVKPPPFMSFVHLQFTLVYTSTTLMLRQPS